MKVSLIGTGNVATQLAQGLEARGFTIDEIYGRDVQKLRQVVGKLYVAEGKSDLDFGDTKSALIVVCVQDAAIEAVARELILPESCLLVHTSGSVPMEALSSYHDRVGVFYPLQSISKNKNMDWLDVPIILNAKYAPDLDLLRKVALKLTGKVYMYNDEQRKALHLAAVFGSNFNNHLLKIVKDISEAEGLDFQMFKSLVVNTVYKAFEIGPEQAQTGPAIRNDKETMRKHLEMLDGSSDLNKIYKMLSAHIQETYS